MTQHTPQFHAALERMGLIAQLTGDGLSSEEIVAAAILQGLPERDVSLAMNLLPEACGYVLAEEIQIQMADTFLLCEEGRETECSIEESDDFQAAYFLAHHMRHGGRNDLFSTLVSQSSVVNALSNAMNGSASMQITDLTGAQFSPIVIWI